MPDNLLNHSEKCWFCYLRIIGEHVTAAVGQKIPACIRESDFKVLGFLCQDLAIITKLNVQLNRDH